MKKRVPIISMTILLAAAINFGGLASAEPVKENIDTLRLQEAIEAFGINREDAIKVAEISAKIIEKKTLVKETQEVVIVPDNLLDISPY